MKGNCLFLDITWRLPRLGRVTLKMYSVNPQPCAYHTFREQGWFSSSTFKVWNIFLTIIDYVCHSFFFKYSSPNLHTHINPHDHINLSSHSSGWGETKGEECARGVLLVVYSHESRSAENSTSSTQDTPTDGNLQLGYTAKSSVFNGNIHHLNETVSMQWTLCVNNLC